LGRRAIDHGRAAVRECQNWRSKAAGIGRVFFRAESGRPVVHATRGMDRHGCPSLVLEQATESGPAVADGKDESWQTKQCEGNPAPILAAPVRQKKDGSFAPMPAAMRKRQPGVVTVVTQGAIRRTPIIRQGPVTGECVLTLSDEVPSC